MTQGFEDDWPAEGWALEDFSSTDGGVYQLGDRNCHPRTGGRAGWMVGGGTAGSALGCNANYPHNLNTWAEYGPFDLSSASAASLVFRLYGVSEFYGGDTCDFDYLFVGASDNGLNYFGGYWCGTFTDGTAGNGYWAYTVDLSDWLGEPAVYVGFNMVSDSSVAFNGLTLDDLAIDVTSSCATPAAPALTAPANGASMADTTPTFSWSGVANANNYDIQIDNNADFSSPVINQTVGATTFTPGAALANGTYNWRVGGNNTAGGCDELGPWSAVRTFTITNTPACFQLTLDHTGQGSNPTASPGSSTGCSAGRYTAGQTINLNANAANGWHVNNWQGTNNNPSTANNNTATMPAGNHTVRVNYVQNVSGNARAFLPSVHWGSTNFLGPFEIEPNNSQAQANGPILLNRNYQGFPNDLADWYFFNLPAGGSIGVVLTNITGKDPQLHLYNAAGGLIIADTVGPAFSLTHNAQPGVYYVRVVVVGNYNQTTPYTLRVNQPAAD